ncbi:hypothetical protein [Microbacterium sp. 3J1]|uniref:DUF6993 domain-containing protein n=1 Tax=Microbacterium sp. 3J1 TaxID=861269 RepID=UPI000A806C0E|nr:hypothetical protein [Microbacterium sp. 3J1]
MFRRPAAPVSLAAVVSAAALALVLVSCSPEQLPDPEMTSDGPTPGPSAAPQRPAYVADGSAEDNLPLFASVTSTVWQSDQRGSGRAYIDALVTAGFDRAAMQVTQDATTVGNAVESLQFSVRWGDAECLVGQVGPSTGEPVTLVMPQLAEGRCLVGATRAIDW